MITQKHQLAKKVIDTIEIGEIEHHLVIANNGIHKDYYVSLGYRFSYDEKEGDLTEFKIKLVGNGYEKANFPVGDNIAELLSKTFAAEWPNGVSEDQLSDMVCEVIEFVQGKCQQMFWRFFMKLSEYEDEQKAKRAEG